MVGWTGGGVNCLCLPQTSPTPLPSMFYLLVNEILRFVNVCWDPGNVIATLSTNVSVPRSTSIDGLSEMVVFVQLASSSLKFPSVTSDAT